MLNRLLNHLNNFFLVKDGIHRGTYEITGGSFTVPFLLNGQYFRITGSILNDGVYKYPAENLKDETFKGSIWALKIPEELIEISEQMKTWEAANTPSAFTSESFDGYSYSKTTNSKTGGTASVFDAFRSVLNPYRKIGKNLEVVQPSRGARIGYTRPFNPDYPWRY